jgi:hypothetical protein
MAPPQPSHPDRRRAGFAIVGAGNAVKDFFGEQTWLVVVAELARIQTNDAEVGILANSATKCFTALPTGATHRFSETTSQADGSAVAVRRPLPGDPALLKKRVAGAPTAKLSAWEDVRPARWD